MCLEILKEEEEALKLCRVYHKLARSFHGTENLNYYCTISYPDSLDILKEEGEICIASNKSRTGSVQLSLKEY